MKHPLRIDDTLRHALESQAGTFTQAELLDTYRQVDTQRTKRQSRQFINSNLVRLTKLGILVKANQCTGRKAAFNYIPVIAHSPAVTAHLPTKSVMATLRQKLHQHRVELLSTLGEAEAYDDICRELPELQACVQHKYDEARDRSSKLLGRIRALESLIADESSSAT